MFSLIGSVISGISSYVSKKQDITHAEMENTAALLRDRESNNSAWEMATLSDKDKWLRRISFGMFAGPFIWALFDAPGVYAYFNVALKAMPDWYVQTFMSMIGGIWGVSALKNTLPSLVGGIMKALRK